MSIAHHEWASGRIARLTALVTARRKTQNTTCWPPKHNVLTQGPARCADYCWGLRRFADDGAVPGREERRKPLQDPAIPHPQSAPALLRSKLRSAVHPRARLEPRRQ